MADVLFVSKEDIIRKSPYVDGNLDADKIIPALHLAQVQYLKEITGTDLYNKLSKSNMIDFSPLIAIIVIQIMIRVIQS